MYGVDLKSSNMKLHLIALRAVLAEGTRQA